MKKQQDKLNEVTLRRLREAYADHPVRKADETILSSTAPDGLLQALLGPPPTGSRTETPATPISFALKAEEFARFRLAALEAADDDELSSESDEEAEVEASGAQVSPDERIVVRPTESDERIVKLLALISDRIPSSQAGTMIRLSADPDGSARDGVRVQAVQLDWHRPLGRPANEPITLTVSLDQELEPLAEELAETIIAQLDVRVAAMPGRGEPEPEAPFSSKPHPARAVDLPLAWWQADSAPAKVPARASRPGGRWRRLLVGGVVMVLVVLGAYSVMELDARGHFDGVRGEIASRLELALSSRPSVPVPEIALPPIQGFGASAKQIDDR